MPPLGLGKSILNAAPKQAESPIDLRGEEQSTSMVYFPAHIVPPHVFCVKTALSHKISITLPFSLGQENTPAMPGHW